MSKEKLGGGGVLLAWGCDEEKGLLAGDRSLRDLSLDARGWFCRPPVLLSTPVSSATNFYAVTAATVKLDRRLWRLNARGLWELAWSEGVSGIDFVNIAPLREGNP